MQEHNFFEHFCVEDDEKAINELYNFKDANYPLLKISVYPFIKNATDVALTEADIIQEVMIYFWENRKEICQKKQGNASKKNLDITGYFLQSLKNKCIDYERKNQHKFNPPKISKREKKEILWSENYSQYKEDLLINEGKLSRLEFEAVTVFALHQISDHLKLLTVLNLIVSYKNELKSEMKEKEWLFEQLELTVDLKSYLPIEIYKLKTKDLKAILDIEENTLQHLNNQLRKFKQYIKRKLNRKGLWKDIQHT